MTRVMLGLVLALAATNAFAAEKSAKSDCKGEVGKVEKLTKQVEELRGKLAAAEAEAQRLANAGAGLELSVLGAVTSAGTLVGNAFQQALDATDLDEKAALHLETAKAASVDAMGKVQAIDLSAHVDKLKSHDLYKTHVAPALDAAAKKYDEHVRPSVDQHVTPAFEKAKAAATQTMDTALPELKKHKATVSDAFSQIMAVIGNFEVKLGDILSPLFDFAAKLSPAHAKLLPSRPLDRLLFLLMWLVFSYYSVFVAKFVVTFALRIAYSSTSIFIKTIVILPLRIILKLLSIATCCLTCFYCCGLCRRKAVVSDAGKKEKKGGEKKEQKKPDVTKKATAEEVTQLLEASKKKGKLDDAVKLLCSKERDCKPLEGKAFPENVRGKMLDKAVLKKAFSNFKEIDVKKL